MKLNRHSLGSRIRFFLKEWTHSLCDGSGKKLPTADKKLTVIHRENLHSRNGHYLKHSSSRLMRLPGVRKGRALRRHPGEGRPSARLRLSVGPSLWPAASPESVWR